MLHFHLGLQVDACYGLRETDDGLQLTHRDGDPCTLLGHFLIFGIHTIRHIHVLEDVTRLF
jgi:hypothetical protein